MVLFRLFSHSLLLFASVACSDIYIYIEMLCIARVVLLAFLSGDPWKLTTITITAIPAITIINNNT